MSRVKHWIARCLPAEQAMRVLRPCPAFGLVAAGALVLAGCQPSTVPAEVTAYNHMLPGEGWAVWYSVNGVGANVNEAEGGGTFTCCLSIPRRWKPGMKVKVEWRYDRLASDPRPLPPPQEAEVEIPDYNERGPGKVQVHFYPDHGVKVLVTRYGVQNPRNPLSEAEKYPWSTDQNIVDFYKDEKEE